MHRAPLGEIARQHAPLAAAFQQVKHRAKDLVKIHRARFGPLAYALQQRKNLLKLISAEVTRIRLIAHTSNIADPVNREQALRKGSG